MQNTVRRTCSVRDLTRRATRIAAVCLAVTFSLMVLPRFASAHGITTPNASSYLAKVRRAPRGVQAKVVDGDLRMWMRVAPWQTVEVLDYSGAPYARFSRSGVEVNRNSAIYYLNLTPVEVPPAGLTAKTPPSWEKVSGGHEYGWHDGRLAALASTVLAPGATYVGTWRIALRVNGRLSSLSGGVWHAPDPPITWFWPVMVILACVLAAYRLRRPALDLELSRALAVTIFVSIAIGVLGRQLEGRPTITAWQIGLLVVILALLAAGLTWAIWGRPGCFFLFVVCVASLWEDFELIPTLIHGYVLMAMPAFLIRVAAVLCLGAGAGLLLLVVRLADLPEGSVALPRRARRGSPA